MALGGLRRAVEAAPPADRAVVVRIGSRPAEAAAADAGVSSELASIEGLAGAEVVRVVSSGTFAPAGSSTDDVSRLTFLASFERIEAHADLDAGRWPAAGRGRIEAALSTGAADALGLALGGRATLASRVDPGVSVELEVVGIYRPRRDDPYWLADPLALDGIEQTGRFTTRGPFVVDREDVAAPAIGRTVALEWRVLPDVRALRVEDLGPMRADIDAVDDRLRLSLPTTRQFSVTSGLPPILATVDRSVLVSRSGVLLLSVQFAVLAGYAIVLVAGLLLERRRTDVALIRSRGASAAHLLTMSLLEALVLAVPAALLAPWLGLAIVRLLAGSGPLGQSGVAADVGVGEGPVLVAVVAGLACVVALALPTLTSAATPAGARAAVGRQARRTLPQRLGLDLALLAVAAIALWQLRLYGAPLTRNARGVLGLDPILLAAPAIGLLGGAVLATRIVPRAAEIAERLLERRRGLVGPLGGRQLARRPLRYTRAALLLMLAAALATFAAAHGATWTRSQADQAAYRAGADVRVVAGDYPELPGWAVAAAVETTPGVVGTLPVLRKTIDVGRSVRGAPLLALDPGRAAGLVYRPDDDAGRAIPAALSALVDPEAPPSPTVAIPNGTDRLAITLDVDLHDDPSVIEDLPDIQPVPAGWAGMRVRVVVEDGHGRLQRLDGGEALFQGRGQRVDVPLAIEQADRRFAPVAPLRLVAIELPIRPPDFTVVVGTVEIVRVEAATESGPATAFGFDAGADGWRWVDVSPFSGMLAYRPPPGRPGLIVIGEGGTGQALFGAPGATGTVMRLLAAPEEAPPLRIVAGGPFLELSAARVGEVVRGTANGSSTPLQVVASTTSFPTLDPAQPSAIADVRALDLLRFAETGQVEAADEFWLDVIDGSSEAVADAMAQPPVAAREVVDRMALTRALRTDPIPLGVIGILGLGSLAALAFAAIGYVVSSTISASERLGELALLRALGMSGGELSVWLSLENVFLLVVGLVTGTGLGLVLAWLVLPFATLTESGGLAVPTPVVVLPWDALVPMYLLAAVLLLVTILVVRRQLPAMTIGGILRARDE